MGNEQEVRIGKSSLNLSHMTSFVPCDNVYTRSWHLASENWRYHCISCEPNWNSLHRKWSLHRCPWVTRHRGLCQTSRAHWVTAQISGPWFCPCWTTVLFLSCCSSRGSASLAIPPVIKKWWLGHLHIGFPRDILDKTFGRGLTELWWTVRGSGKSLGEHPPSHWTLHSGCNQNALCF